MTSARIIAPVCASAARPNSGALSRLAPAGREDCGAPRWPLELMGRSRECPSEEQIEPVAKRDSAARTQVDYNVINRVARNGRPVSWPRAEPKLRPLAICPRVICALAGATFPSSHSLGHSLGRRDGSLCNGCGNISELGHERASGRASELCARMKPAN